MRPTPKQLAYLRTLAQRTGETFTYPQTIAEASAEIDRLQGRPRSSRAERQHDPRVVCDALASRPDDATRVRDHEITGHGSSARWAGDETPARSAPVVGERVELARYSTTTQERILLGQRVGGVVRVLDKPADGEGRSFLVERGLETKAELDGLIADYIAQSTQRDEPAVLIGADYLRTDRDDA